LDLEKLRLQPKIGSYRVIQQHEGWTGQIRDLTRPSPGAECASRLSGQGSAYLGIVDPGSQRGSLMVILGPVIWFNGDILSN
jgi:hypothetical protein